MLTSLTLPVALPTRTGQVVLRRATMADLDDIVALMSDDAVSAARGDVNDPADRARYAAGLRGIIDDDANDIVVAVDEGHEVIGTLQLTAIPGLARQGATRLLVEAVRVASPRRSHGVGEAMMRWTMETAAAATGSSLVQLTSDRAREDAHRFYERLGFTGSHLGFKYQVGS